jgi:hypothetical protein
MALKMLYNIYIFIRRSVMRDAKQKIISFLILMVMLFIGTLPAEAKTNYKKAENWAFKPTQLTKPVDVFFICPSVYRGKKGSYNMSLADKESKRKFVGATNMEKGIYDKMGDMYAPYYQSISLAAYELPEHERQKYIRKAYADVQTAFKYYLDKENKGRPIILAGFSQGSELAVKLLGDMDPQVAKRVIATYAIGWRLTKDDVKNPNIKAAQGEKDLNTVVAFTVEDPSIRNSIIVPAGTTTLSINPLNWRTDSQIADKWHNEGAVFADYSGKIKKEIPYLTGAYLSPLRGTLKVTDIDKEVYPPILSLFAPGVYHLYDYQFFYRNLQDNVYARTAEFMKTSPYGKQIAQWYTDEAHTALADIEKNLPVRDYHLKLRKPRDVRMLTEAIAIHHSGTPEDDDWTAPELHKMHLRNGWFGIGYHFNIRKDGTVEIGTPLETIGAHAYDHNINTIGIHLAGNFEIAKPTQKQLASLEQLVADLAKDYHITINAKTVAGHRYFNSDTACPGYYLNNLLPAIRSKAIALEQKLA